MASATALPVVVYDIPVRTGRKIALETLLGARRAAANIVAVKDAAGDVAGTARLIAAAGPSFDCYCGDDPLTLPLLAVGAVGIISVACPLGRARDRRDDRSASSTGTSRRARS